jgi:hypothetical protein
MGVHTRRTMEFVARPPCIEIGYDPHRVTGGSNKRENDASLTPGGGQNYDSRFFNGAMISSLYPALNVPNAI